MPDISLSGLSVTIGMPTTRDLNPQVVRCLLATQECCIRMGIPFSLAMVQGNAVIQWARDEVIDLFLQTNTNRLFWVDSDIIWETKDFITMLALSQEREVICATYPAKLDTTTYYINRSDNGPLIIDEFGLVEVLGVGLGFTVIRREAIEGIVSRCPLIRDEISGRELYSVFQPGYRNGQREGEDMQFFRLVSEAGYKVWLNPTINLGHIGQKIYNGSLASAVEIRQ